MKLLMISLGCDKNLVDSENMMGLIASKGFEFTDDEKEADVIVVNTCCFIGDAKEESVETILQMAENKVENGGNCKALIVSGCLAQRYFEEMKLEIPEVDAVIGTNSTDKIVDAIEGALNKNSNKDNSDCVYIEKLTGLPTFTTKRLVTTGGHYAYLKIAEGCNKRCTYCIIPKLRGVYRSVPMQQLIDEAKRLSDEGVKELILVAQETTLYGVDLYGKKSLPELLEKLSEIEGIKWIRILYAYPEEITDELIDTMAKLDKVCNYIDMPIQHASDTILKKMGRFTTKEDVESIVKRLRDKIPDIAIRTTLITGFPSETEEDHEEMMQFVNDCEFDRLGVFTYSLEEDTKAATFDNQIDENVKIERRNAVMELQQEIVFEKNEEMAGRVLSVFIEGKLPEDDIYAGRTYMDAPGVDGLIFIKATRELMSGDIVLAKVTGANEYDLIGEMIDEPA